MGSDKTLGFEVEKNESIISSNSSKRQMIDSLVSSSSRFDIISEQPEHLLSHILSLLPTKEAIRTSVLSKRWRFLWTSVFRIDINDDEIGGRAGRVLPRKATRFTDWMDKFMLPLEPVAIEKFSLHFYVYDDVTRINKWISAAVFRNVREMTLYLICLSDNPVNVAASVFHCKTLEVLTLICGLVFCFPEHETVCFPNLKFLSFEEVDICRIPVAEEGSVCFPKLEILRVRDACFLGNGDCIMKLVSNCPVLEDLLIKRWVEDNVPNTDLCIPALSAAYLCFPVNTVNVRAVKIGSPIKSLRLYQWKPSYKVLVQKHDYLVDASVYIGRYRSGDYQGEQRVELFKLMTSFIKVYCLTLSCQAVSAIRDCNIMLPTFCNMVRLEVGMECKDLFILQCFLDKSINLRTLIIKKKVYPCPVEAKSRTELLPATKCLVSSLKKIVIDGCNCCPDDVAVVKSMLKCAKVLKRLTVKPLHYAEAIDLKKRWFYHSILKFPRASTAVDFEFL